MRQVGSGGHQIALGVSNTFLLREDGALIFIGAGPEDESDEVLAILRENDVLPSDLDRILVTHAHQDHAAACGS